MNYSGAYMHLRTMVAHLRCRRRRTQQRGELGLLRIKTLSFSQLGACVWQRIWSLAVGLFTVRVSWPIGQLSRAAILPWKPQNKLNTKNSFSGSIKTGRITKNICHCLRLLYHDPKFKKRPRPLDCCDISRSCCGISGVSEKTPVSWGVLITPHIALVDTRHIHGCVTQACLGGYYHGTSHVMHKDRVQIKEN